MHLDSYKMYFLLVSLFAIANGQFLEGPTNQTISVGEIAQYRCRHTSAIFITWKINDTMIEDDDNDLPPGITRDLTIEDGGVVYILRILGRPEYNTTTVVGVAMISNGLNETTSPTAILQVSMNTTDGNIYGFVEEPLSLNVTIGEKAVFRCEHRSAAATFWRINKTSLSSRSELNNDFNDDILGQLTVTALTKYNNTLIQCVALFDSDNSQRETTAPAILKIQGALNRVDTLVGKFSTLSWKAPFSLDLTNVEPDIAYCVDVYNITCGGRELLISDCDVTETSYTSDVIAPDGYIYEYIVTPRSNVEGAINNGTPSQPLRDLFTSLTMNSSQVSMISSVAVAYEGLFTLNETDAPVPSSFTLSLNGIDDLGDMDVVDTNANRNRNAKNLKLDVMSGLPRHRLWNCTVIPYRCRNTQVIVEGDTELSTHDIQNISVTSPQPGEVRVTGDFIDGSAATGLLAIVISTSKIFYNLIERGSDQLHIEGSIQGVVGGEHSISLFVVEESGLPFSRTASIPKVVSVDKGNDVNQPSIEYSLQSTSTGVCITCTFLDSSATDCVAVVHQRISQLNSSGLMNIESSHKLIRSGDTASGCIEGVNMEDYQVGVVEERQVISVTEKSSCAVCVSVGSVVTVVLVLLTLVVSVLIVFVCKRSQQKIMLLRGSPTTTNYHDTESGRGNEYEKSPLDKKDEVTVEMDTESTPPLYSKIVSQEPESESAVGHHQTSAPGIPQRAHTVDRSQPVYAETLSTQVNVVAAPPMVDRQEYDQVTGFKNPEGLHYAIVGRKTKPQKTPLDDIRDRVVYSELMPQVSQDVVVDDSNEKDNHPQRAIDTLTHTPFTSLNLLSLLRPVVSKWKQLAEALSVDEDDIDDIFTNNETDEACLCDLLDRFITVHHNWMDIERALNEIGEEHLAERASELYVLPNSVQPEMTDHLGIKVIVPNSVYQPEVESSEVFPTYCTEGNVNGNVSDIRSLNGTSTSVTGLTSKLADPGYGSWHSTEEAGEGFYQIPFCEPATCPTECCQVFFTQLGTDEPQQQNTQSVQSEHEDDCYMSAVMSSCKVSHHVQMPKEEQQRLLRCKPDHQEHLWQEKASLADQNVSVIHRAHHLHERPCSVKASSEATLDSACVGQGWLPDLLESVVNFASSLPMQLSRFKMLIFMMSQEMYQLQATKY